MQPLAMKKIARAHAESYFWEWLRVERLFSEPLSQSEGFSFVDFPFPRQIRGFESLRSRRQVNVRNIIAKSTVSESFCE